MGKGFERKIYQISGQVPDVQAGGGDSPFWKAIVSSGHKLLRALDGQQMMAERLVFGILIDGQMVMGL